MGDLTALKLKIELALGQSTGTVAVCTACAAALPCDGAAFTVMTSDLQRETVYATDPVIGGFEDRQYDVGEGPSLDAFSTGRPVLILDTRAAPVLVQWPGLMTVLPGAPLVGVFSFPMRFGAIDVGVCSFYRRLPGLLDRTDLSFVLNALDLTTLALLELREGHHPESILGHWLAVAGSNRREIHQATGMLMGQLDVTAHVAFARLRAHAFAEKTDIERVANDIVARWLRLPKDPESEAMPKMGM